MGEITNDHDLLIRIDERTKELCERMETMRTNFVTQDEFKPVKMIAYGLVSVVLLAVIGAIVTLVIK